MGDFKVDNFLVHLGICIRIFDYQAEKSASRYSATDLYIPSAFANVTAHSRDTVLGEN